MISLKALLWGGLCSLALQTTPVLAQTATATEEAPETRQEITVIGEGALLYPSVGQMNDHMHEQGDLMVGLRFERSRFGGSSQRGTRSIDDDELSAEGYMMRGKSMTMDMVMLDLMYAPTEDVTLTLSPQYVWNRMTMVGFDSMDGGMGQMAVPMAMGEMRDKTDGLGDTLVAASVRLVRKPHLNALATLGVWIPTGAVDRKNSNGVLLDYSMQPGSGTWDVEPSTTISGRKGSLGWGVQAGYRWRAERRNDSDFRLGHKGRLSGWLSYLVLPTLGLTARAEYTHQGRIKGEYTKPHYDMMSPSDRTFNYGGNILTGSMGANWELRWNGGRGPQLGIEVGVPLHQKVYGIQMPQDWRFTTAIRQMF